MKLAVLLNTFVCVRIACISVVCVLACHQGALAITETNTPLRERIKDRMEEKRAERNSDAVDAVYINQPGDYTRTLQHDGITRRYLIHVPKTYKANTPVLLLFAFHGGGGDMEYMANDEYYGLISKAEEEGFVVVFPNGYSKFRSGKFATWNAGNCCANARDKNIDDVGFVKKILKQVNVELNINRNKIFATGMSNGGMMSYRLACEMAGTFKAIAAVAGTDNTVTCNPRVPIFILHIHAKNDDRVLFNGGAGDKFRDESKVTDFISVPDTIKKWVNQNQCNTTPRRVIEKTGAYCEVYSHCKGSVVVQLCVTETGGHSWPGGAKPRGDEPPSQALSANDVMWDFFTSLKP